MSDCLFCKIRDGKIPARLAYEDERALAFYDINPQAPLHALIIPRKHVASLLDLSPEPEDEALVGHLHRVAARLAREAGYEASGFRVLFNTGRDAGQTVFHLHLHVLAGRPLSWPPG
jgi:histidine triad (HIT) family protein